MIKAQKTTKLIYTFVDNLLEEKEHLHPVEIAKRFIKNYGMTSQYRFGNIPSLCYFLGVDSIEYERFPEGIRGFHQIYDDKIKIQVKHDDWSGGINHTILHEMFEIIIDIYNSKAKKEYESSEYKANLFAASILMPEESFLEFCYRANFDLQRVREKFDCSIFSFLIRAEYLFQKRKGFYLGYLYENSYGYPHREDSIESYNNPLAFMCTEKIGAEDIVDPFMYDRFIQEALAKVTQHPSDFIGSVRLETEDFLIRACPISHTKRLEAIRQVGIQIINKNDWQRIKSEVFNESGTLCTSLFRKAS